MRRRLKSLLRGPLALLTPGTPSAALRLPRQLRARPSAAGRFAGAPHKVRAMVRPDSLLWYDTHVGGAHMIPSMVVSAAYVAAQPRPCLANCGRDLRRQGALQPREEHARRFAAPRHLRPGRFAASRHLRPGRFAASRGTCETIRSLARNMRPWDTFGQDAARTLCSPATAPGRFAAPRHLRPGRFAPAGSEGLI